MNNIKIIVVDGGREGSYKTRQATTKEQKENIKNSPLNKAINKINEVKNNFKNDISPAASYTINSGVNIAKQLLSQTANYYISDIGRKNGDGNYQQLINRNFEAMSDATGLLSGAISGAVSGSAFGPVGASIGCVLGLLQSAISTNFKYAEREREYEHEMFKQNHSQAYQLSQAGYSVWNGRKPS